MPPTENATRDSREWETVVETWGPWRHQRETAGQCCQMGSASRSRPVRRQAGPTTLSSKAGQATTGWIVGPPLHSTERRVQSVILLATPKPRIVRPTTLALQVRINVTPTLTCGDRFRSVFDRFDYERKNLTSVIGTLLALVICSTAEGFGGPISASSLAGIIPLFKIPIGSGQGRRIEPPLRRLAASDIRGR